MANSRLDINNGNFTLKVDSINLADRDSVNNLMRLIDNIKGKSFEDNETFEEHYQTVNQNIEESTLQEERPIVRDRLPNVVDINEVKVTKAETNNVGVRCPNCGQSHVVFVYQDNNIYLMRKKYNSDFTETFELVMELSSDAARDMMKPYNAKEIDYFDDIQKIKVSKDLKDKDLVFKEGDTFYCPVCRAETDFTTMDWIQCYNTPTNYGFDTDFPCDVCGSETVEVQINGEFVKRCENKECAHEKRFKQIKF